MIETYYAGAYWDARKESPEECGRRAESMFSALRTVAPDFAHWLKQGRSRKEALLHPIEPDRATLTKMFRRGKDRMFEDLGFTISGWNGADDDEATAFLIRAGLYAECISNACVFNLPSPGLDGKESPSSQRELTANVLSGMVRAMAVAWEPEWAIATSTAYRDEFNPRPLPTRLWDWVSYYSDVVGRVPPLPAPVRMERVENQGTLIVLTPERFTAKNPEHVALAHRVRELLDRAGLLGPPRP